jgi:hypothetical protein
MMLCDRSGRSAWPEVAPGLTTDSQQQKHAQTVVSTWTATGCVQFFGEEKRFRTAWTRSGAWPGRHPALRRAPDSMLTNPLCCHEPVPLLPTQRSCDAAGARC